MVARLNLRRAITGGRIPRRIYYDRRLCTKLCAGACRAYSARVRIVPHSGYGITFFRRAYVPACARAFYGGPPFLPTHSPFLMLKSVGFSFRFWVLAGFWPNRSGNPLLAPYTDSFSSGADQSTLTAFDPFI